MAEINYNDVIYATLTRCGNVIASVKLCGVTSFENILHQIRKIVSESVGLVTLQIRNYSQGWSQNKTLVIATKEPKQFIPMQLSLF